MPLMRKIGMTAACAILVAQSATFAALARDEDRPSIQTLLKELNTQDWTRRNEIERLLNERKAEAAEALVDALDSSDPAVQANAAEYLDRLSSNWEFVVSDKGLATILGITKATRNEKMQSHLIGTLGHIGPRNDQIQETLIALISKSNAASVKNACANALSALIREEKAKSAEPAVKALANLLQSDPSPHVRSAAANALSQCHALPDVVVPALIKAVDDNYRQVRTSAAQALGQYGVRSRDAIPKLLELFKSETDTGIRQTCMYSLQAIGRGNPEVVKVVIDSLDDPQMESYALSYISSFGADAAPAVPKLLSIVESNQNLNTRINAARALAQIGPAAKSAMPSLEKLNEATKSTSINSYIQEAIRRISALDGQSGGM